MKLFRQILSLVLIALLGGAVLFTEWFFVTRRCKANFGANIELKSIDAEHYLPFGDATKIVKAETLRPESTLRESIAEAFSEADREDLPVLDGAAALLPVYSSVFHALYPEDAYSYDGDDFAADSVMQYRNTLRGYKAIVDGTADIFFSAAPNQAQLDYAAEKGVELELIPIGREAFVFLVNSDNPTDDLTVSEIRDIYTGKIRYWNEVGGENRLINPIQRLKGSGSQTMMEAFMKGQPMKPALLGFLGGSIGFSFRFYVEDVVGNVGVKMISLNGVYPSRENIKSGAYPVTVPFYAVVRKGENTGNVKTVIDYLLSEEGQELIEACGYTGL